MAANTELRKQLAAPAIFESTVEIAEKRYDLIVNSLLEQCDGAIKSQDWRLLKQLQEIVTAWINYFEAQKAYVQKAFDDSDSTKKGVIMFMDDQIKFFKLLNKDLMR